MEQNGIERVDFLKIDVDGYEAKVLRGAESTLGRDHPSICMELSDHTLARVGDSLSALLGRMRMMGYRFYGIVDRREVSDQEINNRRSMDYYLVWDG